jgi:hypothetical protein
MTTTRTRKPTPRAVDAPDPSPPVNAHAIEDEVLAVRERLAVMFAATIGMKTLNSDEGASSEMAVECLEFGLSRVLEDVEGGLKRIVDLAFGKGDTEAP